MINKVDFFVWARHYHDHAAPIWNKLPDNIKGNYHISTHLHNISDYNLSEFINENIIIHSSIDTAIKELRRKKGVLVVFGLDKKMFSAINRPFILVSHGVGQTIEEDNKYIPYHKKCLLYILPNKIVENVYKRNYPHVKTAVVGCPKLDYWHTHPGEPKAEKPVVAISFHFENSVAPEMRSAWPYFKPALKNLALQKKWRVLGHGHPGIIDELTPYYQKLGIEVVRDFTEVMKRANLYICDNSSTLYEFASTNRPVVVLNAPWYRRDIERGIRFWEHADVGVNCDNPDDLLAKIEEALIDPPEQKRLREKAVKAVYAVTDGTASQRAVKAIIDFLASEEYKEYCSKASALDHVYPGLSALLEQKLLKDNCRKNRTIIFGGGEHTERLIKVIDNKSFNIIGIVDNDPNKQGSYIMGYRIFHPNEILLLNPDIIIISSFAYEKEIHKQIESLCNENNIRLYSIYDENPNFQEDIFYELYFKC